MLDGRIWPFHHTVVIGEEDRMVNKIGSTPWAPAWTLQRAIVLNSSGYQPPFNCNTYMVFLYVASLGTSDWTNSDLRHM